MVQTTDRGKNLPPIIPRKTDMRYCGFSKAEFLAERQKEQHKDAKRAVYLKKAEEEIEKEEKAEAEAALAEKEQKDSVAKAKEIPKEIPKEISKEEKKRGRPSKK